MIILETKQYQENIQMQTMYNEGFDSTDDYFLSYPLQFIIR
jgi:hypothetical protein